MFFCSPGRLNSPISSNLRQSLNLAPTVSSSSLFNSFTSNSKVSLLISVSERSSSIINFSSPLSSVKETLVTVFDLVSELFKSTTLGEDSLIRRVMDFTGPNPAFAP
ncbi:hypothetical protein WICPIJ_009126 [Wickerhamomyces pijperi]|uniref:Uncharacterized protein n=1 Tax=Wickerhamomyces pijperi TaxID=599730 RepID=A0A9P8PQH1_WICPI|nr:hypothetical protein WICPIJ_009126 [Wickerhamomyces pijperi]